MRRRDNIQVDEVGLQALHFVLSKLLSKLIADAA